MRAVCHIDIIFLSFMIFELHKWLFSCLFFKGVINNVIVLKNSIRLVFLLVDELSWSIVCDAPKFFLISLAFLVGELELSVASV